MEVLRSEVAGRAPSDDDDRSIGGVYGSKGFFFQQRRGHLNLRGIAKVNIEKMVREVDIDTLQQHIENITFCNLREEDLRYLTDPQIVKIFRISQLAIEYLLYSQDQLVDNMNKMSKKYTAKKKSLAKKRKELAELNESTKQLRNQVKAKKQNIATLEELLKETNRTRERELRKAKIQKEQPKMQLEPPEDPMLRFYVAGPGGLCVEFTEERNCSVAVLISEVNKAFISKRDPQFEDIENCTTKLVFKGKLLLPEKSLEASGVRDGDTLMVIIEAPQRRVEVEPVTEESKQPDQQAITQQLLEFLTKQQQESLRELAQDINGGWQAAVETLANAARPHVNVEAPHSTDPQVLADMNTRWSRTELSLREQLDDLASKQAAASEELHNISILASRRKFILGELESDQDDNAPQRPDNSDLYNRINTLTKDSELTHLDMEGLRALMLKQAQEMEELKRLLAQKNSEQPVLRKQADPPMQPARKEKEPHQPLNKWGVLKNVPEPDAGRQEFKTQEKSPKKPKQVTIVEEERSLLIEAKPEPDPEPVTQPVPEPEPSTSREYVDIVFPRALNPDLSVLEGGARSPKKVQQHLTVTVSVNATVDDLVFEIRNTVATLGRLPFGKVVLNFKGQRVVLGIDLTGEADFTADAAANYALLGDLRVQLLTGNPVTNAQLDMMRPSLEKMKIFSSSTAYKSGDGEADDASVGSRGSSARLRAVRKKRNWDDEDDEEVELLKKEEQEEVASYGPLAEGQISHAMYRKVRNSLDDALSGVSDKEGLTDDEMKNQVSRLRKYTESLPNEVSQHLTSYRGAVADAMGAVAADSGSETGLSGGEELVHSSTGQLHPRTERMALQVSKSLRLSRTGSVQVPGLLRVSTASGLGSVASALSVVDQQKQPEDDMGVIFRNTSRRSIEQYDAETDLGDSFLQMKRKSSVDDDMPMMASINKSTDYRTLQHGRSQRQLSNYDLPSHSGFAEESVFAEAAYQEPQQDSLTFSPSVSVSNTRSRYGSSQHGDESSDHEDSMKERGYADSFAFDVTDASLEEKFRADGKESGMERTSVDSFKKMIASEERKAGGAPYTHRDSNDSAPLKDTGGTGDMSTIQSFDDTLGSEGNSDVGALLRMADDSRVGEQPILSQTVDSEGDLLLMRDHGDAKDINRGEYDENMRRVPADIDVQRHADAYERDAARSNSSTTSSAAVEPFLSPPTDSPAGGGSRYSSASGKVSEVFSNLPSGNGEEETNSVNSLALSESHNLEEDI